MLKVLHVIGGIGAVRTGPQFSCMTTVKYLNKSDVLATIYAADADDQFQPMGVPLHKVINYKGVPVRFFKISKLNKLLPYWWSWGFLKGLILQIRHYDFIHIHVGFYFGSLITSILCRFYKIPYLIQPHGSYMKETFISPRRIMKSIYFRILEKWEIRHAAMILYGSEMEKEHSMSLTGNTNSSVIPNAIDTENFCSVSGLSKKVREDKVTFTFLGRIAPEKGLGFLIEAFRKAIHFCHKTQIYLVIAGADKNGYSLCLKSRVHEYQMDSRVSFRGFIEGEQKELLLKHDTDVFVQPSLYDSFGIAAAEAMYCGLPLIVSDGVGIHTEVTNKNAGLVVNAMDTEALVEAIVLLATNTDLRMKMGKNSKELAESHFTGYKVAQKMKETYSKLCEKLLF